VWRLLRLLRLFPNRRKIPVPSLLTAGPGESALARWARAPPRAEARARTGLAADTRRASMARGCQSAICRQLQSKSSTARLDARAAMDWRFLFVRGLSSGGDCIRRVCSPHIERDFHSHPSTVASTARSLDSYWSRSWCHWNLIETTPAVQPDSCVTRLAANPHGLRSVQVEPQTL